jgi:hypothetical protein
VPPRASARPIHPLRRRHPTRARERGSSGASAHDRGPARQARRAGAPPLLRRPGGGRERARRHRTPARRRSASGRSRASLGRTTARCRRESPRCRGRARFGFAAARQVRRARRRVARARAAEQRAALPTRGLPPRSAGTADRDRRSPEPRQQLAGDLERVFVRSLPELRARLATLHEQGAPLPARRDQPHRCLVRPERERVGFVFGLRFGEVDLQHHGCSVVALRPRDVRDVRVVGLPEP